MPIPEYEAALKELYQKESLKSLWDTSFQGQNPLQLLSQITSTRTQVNTNGRFDMVTSDLIDSISDDVKFSLANIFLYAPDTNNLLNEMINIQGVMTPTYFRKLSEVRFFYFVNATFEKLYNYWDRIGDLLELAFGLSIAARHVYFSTVIQELQNRGVMSSPHGVWLKNFYDNEYQAVLNPRRINIVHHQQDDTSFMFDWLRCISTPSGCSPETVMGLQEQKDAIPGLLKRQLDLATEGFEHAILLIKETGPHEQMPNATQNTTP